MIEEVMEPCDSQWRGLGIIPGSGLRLRDAYRAFDARQKYEVPPMNGKPNPACRCGDVLQGEMQAVGLQSVRHSLHAPASHRGLYGFQ